MVVYASVEDFLYILAGIFWVVFSFYNSKRKKNAKIVKQNDKPKEESSHSLINSLMEEMGLETVKQPEQVSEPHLETEGIIIKSESEPIQDVNSTVEPQNIFSFDDSYEESNDIPMADVIEKYGQIGDQEQDSILNDSITYEKRSKKFDLRKAIIYSEILRKQYF